MDKTSYKKSKASFDEMEKRFEKSRESFDEMEKRFEKSKAKSRLLNKVAFGIIAIWWLIILIGLIYFFSKPELLGEYLGRIADGFNNF